MRGFRGTRANQNQMAHRYGHQGTPHGNASPHNPSGNSRYYSGNAGAPSSQHPTPLPDWLKTPETRAREHTQELQQRQQHPPQPLGIVRANSNGNSNQTAIPHGVSSRGTPADSQRPQLSVIPGGKAHAAGNSARSSTVKAKTTAATRAVSAPKAAIAPKRKAAASGASAKARAKAPAKTAKRGTQATVPKRKAS